MVRCCSATITRPMASLLLNYSCSKIAGLEMENGVHFELRASGLPVHVLDHDWARLQNRRAGPGRRIWTFVPLCAGLVKFLPESLMNCDDCMGHAFCLHMHTFL